MEIQCECRKLRAALKILPDNTPGRLVCYCGLTQTVVPRSFLHIALTLKFSTGWSI